MLSKSKNPLIGTLRNCLRNTYQNIFYLLFIIEKKKKLIYFYLKNFTQLCNSFFSIVMNRIKIKKKK